MGKQGNRPQANKAGAKATSSSPVGDENQLNKLQAHNDAKTPSKEVFVEHLPPIVLVMTILVCSGTLWVFAVRDVFATGKNIAGAWEESMLIFTKSTDFFDDSYGWKSTQGGLSTIEAVTTDANNMGGLFIRKVAGAAALGVHSQKLMPLLFHPLDARWNMGHFNPMLWTAFIGNLAIVLFYTSYMNDLESANADGLAKVLIGVLCLESFVILYSILTNRKNKRGPAVALPQGKSPTSLPSRIVARTVGIVTTVFGLVAARDLFFPGQIISFIPRDDIYLEWTGAFLHSPPEGTVEAEENGLTSSLFVGDKFVAQYYALHMLLLCLFKYVSAFSIRFGSDGSGLVKCRMIWKSQAIGGALLLMLFRLFSPAALTASLDLRYHLMGLAYETFIIGLYGYF